jgi:hypothetical protein
VTPTVLLSLGELDWRIGPRPGGGLLLDDFWERQRRRIEIADAEEQVRILELVTPIAAFAPSRALAVARDLMATPGDGRETPPRRPDGGVMRRLPALLGAVAFSPSHLPEVLQMLWQIGRDDRRPTHEHEDHAFRAIFALSRYRRGPEYFAGAWAFIQRLLDDEDAVVSYAHSPIELIPPLLAREGVDPPDSRGMWRSYYISIERTAPLRAEVRAKLIDLATTSDDRSRVLAAEMLSLSLAEPHGYGVPVTPNALAECLPDQRLILAAIERVLGTSDDPLVRLTLIEALVYHSQHSSWPDVAEIAGKCAHLDRTPRDELVWLLRGRATLGDGTDSYDQIDERAAPIVATVEDPDAFAEELDRELVAMHKTRVGRDPDPGALLLAITTIDARLAGSLAVWCVRHPDRVLTRFAGRLLAFLATVDMPTVHRVLEAARRGDHELRRIVADYVVAVARYWAAENFSDQPLKRRRRGLRRAKPAPRLEAQLLRQCLADPDRDIVARALAATEFIGAEDSALGSRHLVCAQIGQDSALAELFSTTARTVADSLDEAAAREVLDKLVAVPELEDVSVLLLGDLGSRFPEASLSFLLTRAAHGGGVTNRFLTEYDGEFIGGASAAQRREMLRSVAEVAAASDAGQGQEFGYVYCALTSDLPARCEVLAEWIGHPDDRRGETARTLLEGMPWYTLLVCPDFVADALTNAARRGSGEAAGTKARLLGLADRCPQRDNLIGSESDEICTLRDEAAKHVERFPAGSPAALFFTELSDYAQKIIGEIELEEEEYPAQRR